MSNNFNGAFQPKYKSLREKIKRDWAPMPRRLG
jgi:hypothetical protein